jgi:signal transduction histidine kinase
MNLLTNALKYSSPGSEVMLIARLDGAMEAVISVVDRGKGISPTDLLHIFDRFYRSEETGKIEGLGLGLYITRMLVEAHGGRIWAESELEKGSAFYFTLPLAL